MGRKRNMPSKKDIYEYWKYKLNPDYSNLSCFKCGFDKGIQRAHIKSVCEGGTDELNNIHLLCKNCHLDSEAWSGYVYDIWLSSLTKESFANKLLYGYFAKKINIPEDLSKKFDKIKTECIEIYSEDEFLKALNNIQNKI